LPHRSTPSPKRSMRKESRPRKEVTQCAIEQEGFRSGTK
jgi:hypothetical protein